MNPRFFSLNSYYNFNAFALHPQAHEELEDTILFYNKQHAGLEKRFIEAAEDMTAIWHVCLNLFQQESSKLSVKRKRLKAAWDDVFRAKVLFC